MKGMGRFIPLCLFKLVQMADMHELSPSIFIGSELNAIFHNLGCRNSSSSK